MNRTLQRRRLLTVGAALAAAGLGGRVLAQPTKVLRLVVPFSAGGTADVLPRIVADKLRAAFPAGIIIDNKTGAGGNIGGDFVARADPDGTTLLVSPPGPIAINQHLYKTLPFDPTKWVPVTMLATVPNALDVSNTLPVKDVAGFIAYLRSNPGKVSYASQGNGTTSHLTACLFMQLTGTRMLHVPYKGSAPALADIMAGNVDVFFDNISSSARYHTSGKLRVLAVADDERSPILPNVPTFAEAKVPGMRAVTFFSVVAPAATPKEPVDYAQKHFAAALAAPDVKQKFLDQGATACGWTSEKTGQFIRQESERWGQVIKTANVTLE